MVKLSSSEIHTFLKLILPPTMLGSHIKEVEEHADGGWGEVGGVARLVICRDTAQDTTTTGGLITEQVPEPN